MIKTLLPKMTFGLSNSVFDFLGMILRMSCRSFDGEEGLYEAESGHDLIFADLMLPEKDGFHVLKQKKA